MINVKQYIKSMSGYQEEFYQNNSYTYIFCAHGIYMSPVFIRPLAVFVDSLLNT